MANHVNINHPDINARYRHEAVTIAELRAKISVLETYLRSVESDLEAIFTRIEDDEEVELHMKSGEVYIIAGKVRR